MICLASPTPQVTRNQQLWRRTREVLTSRPQGYHQRLFAERARTPHTCRDCGAPIQRGEMYGGIFLPRTTLYHCLACCLTEDPEPDARPFAVHRGVAR
ncbi:MAG TPA: hypothetical protein VGN26_04030 [Armatimonadota bacterium]|jgi:hypothetical protein